MRQTAAAPDGPLPYSRDLGQRWRARKALLLRTAVVWAAAAAAIVLQRQSGTWIPDAQAEGSIGFVVLLAPLFPLTFALIGLGSMRLMRTMRRHRMLHSWRLPSPLVGFAQSWILGGFSLFGVMGLVQGMQWFAPAAVALTMIPGPNAARLVAATQWLIVGLFAFSLVNAEGAMSVAQVMLATLPLFPVLFVAGLMGPPWFPLKSRVPS